MCRDKQTAVGVWAADTGQGSPVLAPWAPGGSVLICHMLGWMGPLG